VLTTCMLAYGFHYYDSALKAACTSTSKFAVPVLPNAVVMYLPFSGDELRPQSAVIDHSKHYTVDVDLVYSFPSLQLPSAW